MTLTYRGKKYMQLQGAGFDATKKIQLTYRGLSYTKWRTHLLNKPRLERGYLLPSSRFAPASATIAANVFINIAIH